MEIGKKHKKMRIIRTIESFYPYMSGPANDAFLISSEIEKRGMTSPILTSDYKARNSPKHEKIGGVEVFRFPVSIGFMKYLITRDMKKHLEDFDIINAHNHRSYQTEIAFKAAKKAGKPFVINVHGSLLGYDHYLKGLAKLPYIIYDLFGGKRIIKRADAVIVNSRKEYHDAVHYGVQKNKIHILPSGINVDDYTPLRKNDDHLTILFVGRISRNRNLEPLIRAISILDKDGSKNRSKHKLEVFIVGGEVKSSDTSRSGYLDELKRLAQQLNIQESVKFVGEKKGSELREYYRTSDIFIYPSSYENFGQTILEAGAAGLPIICTPVGIAPEIVQDGKNGFLVKGEPEEIADRITRLFDAKKRAEFGRITREKVRRDFNPEKIIDKYVRLYQSLSKMSSDRKKRTA